FHVTGVQTCALPIYAERTEVRLPIAFVDERGDSKQLAALDELAQRRIELRRLDERGSCRRLGRALRSRTFTACGQRKRREQNDYRLHHRRTPQDANRRGAF